MRSFSWYLSQSARYSSTNNLCGIIFIGGSVRISCIHHHYLGFFLIIVTQMAVLFLVQTFDMRGPTPI